ncbi:MAG: hypothetical protein Ct9H300mP5_0470 [Candidatus Pelagibacterales bacterium]|nr:MAG: hypothetical protein Ct9H300mP5_0470 [Pelagibacterales bacterium]
MIQAEGFEKNFFTLNMLVQKKFGLDGCEKLNSPLEQKL